MRNSPKSLLSRLATLFATLSAVLVVTSCTKEEEFPPRDNTEEVQSFYQEYNSQVKTKLASELEQLKEELAGAELSDDEKAAKQEELVALELRNENPEFFSFLTLGDLPEGLAWQTNKDEPELGSERAKKGGVYHTAMSQFPATLRVIGDQSNNSFRSEHSDNIGISMVMTHPNTGKTIPGVADRWAVSDDQRTVYFHIDEKATYNDGVPVESDDVFMCFYMSLGPYINSPYRKQYFSNQFSNITRYDANYFSITMVSAKPNAAESASVSPYPRHFYKEVGPDFVKRYNWRPQPTTGAYFIESKDILKGRSITLTRVKDWWAKDRKYMKNRFNADKIQYRLIRDSNTALEYFKKGKLEFSSLSTAKNWYEKTEFDAVFDGYIEKAVFYADYPAVPRGLYINCAKPLLNNRDIRIGLQHATNFEKVISFDLRGDAERLNSFADGYGRYSHPNIKARGYSEKLALESFAKAGFTKRGEDGVLVNDAGKRLSFTLTYGSSPTATAILSRLKESAIKAGVEYKLESLDGSASFNKGLEKKHELTFSGWGVGPPFPSFRQFFHSSNAYDEATGELKTMTNNFSSYSDPEMDEVSQAIRNARTLDEIEKASHRALEIIHRDAPWIPAYKTPFIRCGYWRWMQWPDDFNVKLTRDFESSYVYWIDEDIKKETLKAKREGRTFPEKNSVYDHYRKN